MNSLTNEEFEEIMYMSTLPSIFKSLVGKTVKIETEEPRCVIELLGDLLGIKDYETNKAAFWFLDNIALQVLRYKTCLDDHYRSILISWLAGEMKLIRDKKLLRKDFLKKMKILFLHVAEKLSSNGQLLHWESLIDVFSEIMSQNSTTADSETEHLITNKLSKEKLIIEDAKYMSQMNEFSIIGRDATNRNNGNSVTKDLSEELSKNFETLLTTENPQRDIITDANPIGSSSSTNPCDVLDVIVEATYNMYANELRYSLIYAVFVKPIHIQIFRMPHVFRIPRQIKLADSKGSFHVQLCERLEEIANESIISNGKKLKGKKVSDAKKEQIIKDLDLSFDLIPLTPPSSLMEDEVLADNRRFILPLIEANEAAQIFEMHAGKQM